MKIEIERDLESLAGEWDQLLKKSSDPSPDRGSTWMLNWLRTYHVDPSRVIGVTVRDSNKLVGLATLMRTQVRAPMPLSVLEFIGGRQASACDRQGFIAQKEVEPEVTSEIVKGITRLPWQILDLRNLVAPRDGTPHPIKQAAESAGLHTEVLDSIGSPYATLEDSAEKQSKRFRHNMRHSLTRYKKLLEQDHPGGINICHLTGEEAIPSIDHLLALHALRRGSNSYWSGHKEQSFLPATLKELLQRKQASLHFIEANGQPIAAMGCLDDEQKRSALIGGFDPAYEGYAPQNLLIWDTIKDSIEAGQQEFHFGKKDSYSKLRWGGDDPRRDVISRLLVYQDGLSSRYLNAVLKLTRETRKFIDNSPKIKAHRGFLVRHRDVIKPVLSLF